MGNGKMIESSEKLNTRAIELASGGYYSEALACLKRAIAIDRNNYYLWYNLGITYRDAGDLENACNALETALTYNPNDSDILDSLGLIYLSIGESECAYEILTQAVETQENNPKLWNDLGVVQFSLGMYEQASLSFEKAVKQFPHYYDALFNLRDTYQELGNKIGAKICDEKLKHITPPQN